MRGRGAFAGRDELAWFVMIFGLWFATSATTLAPTPVGPDEVERAVTAAEWLAARSAEVPASDVQSEENADLGSWLLTAGDVASADGAAAFVSFLGALGYDDPTFAISDWLYDFTRVLAAAEAARRESDLRPLAEIEADLASLPVVPLDQTGAEERDRLIGELVAASIPAEERTAAAVALERIEALRALARGETER